MNQEKHTARVTKNSSLNGVGPDLRREAAHPKYGRFARIFLTFLAGGFTKKQGRADARPKDQISLHYFH